MNNIVGTGMALMCSAALVGGATARAGSVGSRSRPAPKGPRPAVLLVHGAFVDGSGWKKVYKTLTHDGYPVTVVQIPTVSLTDDVAVTKRAIAAQSGPVILVGHSYGGAVISEAGNDPKVTGLIFIAAYAPDEGESLQTLIGQAPKDAAPPPILPPQDGFLFLDREKFPGAFAADVKADEAAFMAASQVPCGVGAVGTVVTTPAWRTKPSFYLVTKNDRMIPTAQQRDMAKRTGATVVETESSHAVMVAHPDVVASVIERAAAAMSPQGK